jgi:hypothetical protein
MLKLRKKLAQQGSVAPGLLDELLELIDLRRQEPTNRHVLPHAEL